MGVKAGKPQLRQGSAWSRWQSAELSLVMTTKLKIDFDEMIRFEVGRRVIRTWIQPLPRERRCVRELAMAERPKPLKRRID
jgi:hypothetical protein